MTNGTITMSRDKSIPLTVIIPVHERESTLARALASLASQDVRPEEVIIVDDGSRQAPEIDVGLMRELNVRVLRHDANRGPAAARNTGMRAAGTDWITFLDSDDLLLGSSLSRRWSLLRDRIGAAGARKVIFGCGWVDFAGDHEALGLRWPRPGRSARDFASGCWFSPGSCVILNRAEALDAVGPQDETLRRFEDFDWFLGLALKGFTLEILPVAAVAIERQRTQSVERIEQAANSVRMKWRDVLDPALFARLDSYMDLEIAAAHRFNGSMARSLHMLASSLAKAPRLSLQLSPGWEIEPVQEFPGKALSPHATFEMRD